MRDTKSAAEKMQLRPKTLENWRSRGFGPAFLKLGARVVYDDADLDAWIASRRRTSTSQQGDHAEMLK